MRYVICSTEVHCTGCTRYDKLFDILQLLNVEKDASQVPSISVSLVSSCTKDVL